MYHYLSYCTSCQETDSPTMCVFTMLNHFKSLKDGFMRSYSY